MTNEHKKDDATCPAAEKKTESVTEFSVERADEYVKRFAPSVVQKYRHTYHAMPPVGWMNDPNGFCYALGKYHLFFQFHPYSSVWGPMHWGHFTTKDFIRWHWEGVALAPDKEYDKDGCYSGSAVEKDGKMYLFYTAVKGDIQTQALAVSSDGVHFKKQGVILSGEKLPADCSRHDFRDPYVFLKDGVYYMLCGSQAKDKDGQILLFRSKDCLAWEFAGKLIKDGKPTRGIYECPCAFTADGKDVIMASPQGYLTEDWRYENTVSAVYFTGKIDFEKGAFAREYEDETDGGFNFYAPQVAAIPDGRTVMAAWMLPGCIESPAADDGWKCAMILPRELRLQNGRLVQSPVREIEAYRKNAVRYENVTIGERTVLNGVGGVKTELIFELEPGDAERAGVRLFESENNYAAVYYSKKDGKIVFDRSATGLNLYCDPNEKDAAYRSVKTKEKNGAITLRVFLDVSCCEVFVNGGERAMTAVVYTKENGEGISFFAEGGNAKLRSLELYDICVE